MYQIQISEDNKVLSSIQDIDELFLIISQGKEVGIYDYTETMILFNSITRSLQSTGALPIAHRCSHCGEWESSILPNPA